MTTRRKVIAWVVPVAVLLDLVVNLPAQLKAQEGTSGNVSGTAVGAALWNTFAHLLGLAFSVPGMMVLLLIAGTFIMSQDSPPKA